jgi:acyl-CoA synthetase (AMP-forming)/AMP-acid ligase II
MNMHEITVGYGMTETSPMITTSFDDSLERRVSTVGRVHPHVEIKIVDAEGRVVPRGTPGELCTRGYSVICAAIGAIPTRPLNQSIWHAGCIPAILPRWTRMAIAE